MYGISNKNYLPYFICFITVIKSLSTHSWRWKTCVEASIITFILILQISYICRGQFCERSFTISIICFWCHVQVYILFPFSLRHCCWSRIHFMVFPAAFCGTTCMLPYVSSSSLMRLPSIHYHLMSHYPDTVKTLIRYLNFCICLILVSSVCILSCIFVDNQACCHFIIDI